VITKLPHLIIVFTLPKDQKGWSCLAIEKKPPDEAKQTVFFSYSITFFDQ